MKAMILTDLVALKNSLAQTLAMFFLVGVAMAIGTGTVVSAAASISTMTVFPFAITLVSYDELNQWQRFRATFPISKRDTVLGRYATILLVTVGSVLFAIVSTGVIVTAASLLPLPEGITENLNWENAGILELSASAFMASLVVLWGVSLMLPLVAKFGMTKATRFAPVGLILIVVAAFALLDSCLSGTDVITPLLTWYNGNPDAAFAAIVIAAFVITIAIYAASASVAVKLYENREL